MLQIISRVFLGVKTYCSLPFPASPPAPPVETLVSTAPGQHPRSKRHCPQVSKKSFNLLSANTAAKLQNFTAASFLPALPTW